jgi:mannose-6-phosphate isomerase-like protein (cupin superfamily)
MKFTIEEMLKQLPLPGNEKWTEGVWDLEPFEKGNVRLVFFAPRGADHQTYHDENEFYFIARGSADILIGSDRSSAVPGDTFYVPAEVLHHFENISDDFATWAVFF